jgi:hypothetical protein
MLGKWYTYEGTFTKCTYLCYVPCTYIGVPFVCAIGMCQLGVLCGWAIWVFYVGVSFGCSLWVRHLGVLCGSAIWVCHLGVPFGCAMQENFASTHVHVQN